MQTTVEKVGKNILKRNYLNRISVVLIVFLLFAAANVHALDKTKYIDIDEIERGMEGYCYTVLSGSGIKKYPLKVVSIVKGFSVGRDSILVVGTDETFKHIGPVRGCSGSPVYIDGRMAGALAAGWGFSKDPLYGVTPIKYMLEVGPTPKTGQSAGSKTSASPLAGMDFASPLDLSAARDTLMKEFSRHTSESGGGMLPIVSSLPAEACATISESLGGTGIFPLAASTESANGDVLREPDTNFAPGGVITIPLISGDISLAATGTITEIDGNKVYAFGHSFIGYGDVDLPMAGGEVHTVVANRNFSFKLASPGPIVGAIRSDEHPGIYGEIAAKPKLIPLRINISRYNMAAPKTFNCKLVYNELYSAVALQAAIIGAVSMQGSLPMEHTIKYDTKISIDGYDPLKFDNVSSGTSIGDVIGDVIGSVAVLMSNPFGSADIDGIDIDIDISAEDSTARVLSAKLDKATVKPGDTIKASVLLQSYLNRKSLHEVSLRIPKDTKPGQYQLMILGGNDYKRFLSSAQPHKFSANDMDTLVTALDNVMNVRNNGLHVVVPLPPSGIVIENKELQGLPGTKTLLLESPKRTLSAKPYNSWLETKNDLHKVVFANETIKIVVEE